MTNRVSMNSEMLNNSPLIEMIGITKRFPDVTANEDVSIVVNPGEVLGLLGENGAGKTTLMNVLYGLYQPNDGEIKIEGKEVDIRSPQDAINHGIGMVHQHFMLVRNFNVVQNLALGLSYDDSPILDLDTVEKMILKLAEDYDISIDPQAKIWQLSVGEQQKVEILNALLREAKILILDEPISVLTPKETESLFNTIRQLTRQGKSVIFISHKLDEALSITDRIAVLRKGKLVDTVKTANTNKQEIAKMMVGREVLFKLERDDQQPGPKLLSIKNINVKNDKGFLAVDDVSLDVFGGEIVGIAGVAGNGQRELCEALAGLRKIEAGSVEIKGKTFSQLSSREAIENGLGFIPEDRQHRGLVLNFPLWRNAIMKRYVDDYFCKNLFLRMNNIFEFSKNLIEKFDIRVPNEKTIVNTMSGGNQQKLILARELSPDPDILLANQPTRGLDVASMEYVHGQLLKQREMGKAVLLVSRELNEVMNISDRIAVMYKGKIAGIVPAEEANKQRIGNLMLGIKEDKAYG